MAEYQAGLHKDVVSIFQGIWDPTVDNTEEFYASPGANRMVYHMRSRSKANRYREPKLASVAKTISEVPGHIFSLKSRRERKRLSSISKHLIINNTAG